MSGYLSEPQTDGPADEAPCWRYNFGHGRWRMAVTGGPGREGLNAETESETTRNRAKPLFATLLVRVES